MRTIRFHLLASAVVCISIPAALYAQYHIPWLSLDPQRPIYRVPPNQQMEVGVDVDNYGEDDLTIRLPLISFPFTNINLEPGQPDAISLQPGEDWWVSYIINTAGLYNGTTHLEMLYQWNNAELTGTMQPISIILQRGSGISIEPDTIPSKAITVGSDERATIRVTNTSGEPLQISDFVSQYAGFELVDADLPFWVEAGEVSEFQFRWNSDTPRRNPQMTAYFTFRNEDFLVGAHRVVIEPWGVFPLPLPVLDPPALILRLEEGDVVEGRVILRNEGGFDYAARLSVLPRGFSVNAEEIACEPGAAAEFTVRFQSFNNNINDYTGLVAFTEPDRLTDLFLPVVVEKRHNLSDLVSQPPVVNFGTVAAGTRDTLAITLVNRNQAPLYLTNQFIDNNFVLSRFNLDCTERDQPVRMEIDAEEALDVWVSHQWYWRGLNFGFIRISFSDLDGNPVLRKFIPVVANVVEPPRLEVERRWIEGRLEEGQTLEGAVGLLNIGGPPLEWRLEPAEEHDWFTVQPREGGLAVGEHGSLNYRADGAQMQADMYYRTRYDLLAFSEQGRVDSVRLDFYFQVSPAAVGKGSPHPLEWRLEGAFPNPFNRSTRVSFTLPEAMEVELAVFDLSGRMVRLLTKGGFQAGRHEASWSGEGEPSGVYLLRLDGRSPRGANRRSTVKAVMIK